LVGVGLVASILAGAFLARSEDNGTLLHYAHYASHGYNRSALRLILRQGRFGLSAVGEIGANFPVGHFQWVDRVLPLIGLVTVAVLVAGWRQSKLRMPVTGYLIFYIGTIAVWPFYTVRFWMPIIPFLVLYALRAFERWRTHTAIRYLVPVYTAWFVFAGLAALADSTRKTFSHGYFTSHYGKQMRVLPGKTIDDPKIKAMLKRVVERYDPAQEYLYELQ
jgi:hypothetical protein